MNLKELYPKSSLDIEITGIATDSRFVQPGFLFIPLPGKKFDGSEFIQAAIHKGAKAVVLNKPNYQSTIPIIVVKDVKEELIRVLKKYYGKPDEELKIIGVTGTDGKTTTASMINYLLNALKPSAYIGTNGISYYDQFEPNPFTTPLLTENFRLLSDFHQKGIEYVAMEVSSEGIVGGRIESMHFDYAIFTNLSHEHLNTHHTLENYFQAKFQLFKQLKTNGIAIVNIDDAMGPRFKTLSNLITFSIDNPSDYQAVNLRYGEKYLTFDLKTKKQTLKDLKLNRLEKYNLYNALPSIIISLREGIDLNTLYKRLITIPIVAGRLEKITTDNGLQIYIDFAHTPNALSCVLSSLRAKTKNNMIVICGATGNKDKTKRPLMGKVACDLADYVIFTSEDPRDEEPIDIINQMSKEVSSQNFTKVVDRFEAINLGISLAEPGDTVIVTGKGREQTFEEKGTIRPYSDYDSILKILNKRK